jgi:hypothetical protein
MVLRRKIKQQRTAFPPRDPQRLFVASNHGLAQ